ncbi:activator of basal transcription 1-like [Trichogramma pretiosum]|uniref:activator of basal transcription 1-like n=1 Tax=Trichogramma pretiosum TaxID=7493 RepID=UPI0006C9BD84|nr:activator of basal transcription 1-like [Trichogramma pretiosum]
MDPETSCTNEPSSAEVTEKKVKKPKKKGIIYLSSIPKYMNVTTIRETFSAYGEVGRVYLQLADKELAKQESKKQKKRKQPSKHFTEGWVEFKSKRVAKHVAATLNNTQISSRKKSKFYDMIWNIKYLPKFNWIHLSERLSYERAVHKQRMRAEIEQVKKEANFFSTNVDRSQKLKKATNKTNTFVAPVIKQKPTEMEIRQQKNKTEDDRTDCLKSWFG